MPDALVVPLIHDNESYGTISLYVQNSTTYSRNDLSMLQTLASILAPLLSESRKHAIPLIKDLIDPTTQIHRMPYLTAIAPQLISFAGKNQTPLSLFYLEIRNLSQIIRIFGVNQGNELLHRIAECIKPELRETDILVHYGGHGFVACLPGVHNDQAFHCVQRLNQKIKSEIVPLGQGYSVDCRAGVSSYPKDGATIMTLLQSAQENMRSASSETATPDNKIITFLPRT